LIKRVQFTALLIATGALLAIPAVGQAHHKPGHSKGSGHAKGHGCGHGCAKKPTVKRGFTVRGTLVSYTVDDPATPNVNETSVETTVTGANRHARVSGELEDMNGTEPGVQVAISSTSADLSGYGTGETPSAGDKVRIVGKIAVTRKKCAAAGDSLDDRYGEMNVRKVKVIDAD